MDDMKSGALHSERAVELSNYGEPSGTFKHRDTTSGYEVPVYEEEQTSDYKVGFQTMAAILALAIANCCATLSNTAGAPLWDVDLD